MPSLDEVGAAKSPFLLRSRLNVDLNPRVVAVRMSGIRGPVRLNNAPDQTPCCRSGGTDGACVGVDRVLLMLIASVNVVKLSICWV